MEAFSVFAWKNVLYRCRTWLFSLLEILAPVCMYLFIAYIYYKSAHGTVPLPTSILKSSNRTKYDMLFPNGSWLGYDLVYSPPGDLTNLIMSHVNRTIGSYLESLNWVDNEKEMEVWFQNAYRNRTRRFGYGVVFDSEKLAQGSLEVSLRCTKDYVQWGTHRKFSDFEIPMTNVYIQNWFAGLQILVNDGFMLSQNLTPFDFKIGAMPRSSRESISQEMAFITIFSSLIPDFAVFGYFFGATLLVNKHIEEKVNGTKDYFKSMGVSELLYFSDLIFFNFLSSLWSTLGVTLTLKTPLPVTGAVLPHSDFYMIWGFFMLYCFLGSSFAIAFSSWFTNVTLGLSVTISVWILPYFALNWFCKRVPLGLTSKCLTCLIPGMGLYWGFQEIGYLEAQGIGLHWDSMFESMAPKELLNMSLGTTVVTMAIISGFYSLVYLYGTAVNPGPYSTPKPWYFIFCFRLWPSKNEDYDTSPLGVDGDSGDYPIGIKIRHLTKISGKQRVLDDINLDIYKGQITALVGQNGAGKTTLLSTIAGMNSPTTGQVFIDDEPLFNHRSKFYNSISLCPQDNILYEYLTVYEHLFFTCIIRRINLTKVLDECDKLILRLSLEEYRHVLVSKLPVLAKRKLSLSIALVGNPKIILLDQSSPGLDLKHRREFWDILQSLYRTRILIIATQVMDEADTLANMIAFMELGEVKFYGTGKFLRRQFGAGYTLRVHAPVDSQDVIHRLILRSVPEAKSLSSRNVTPSVFHLPIAQSSVFPRLFRALQENTSVQDVGLSCTSMDDVFWGAGDPRGGGSTLDFNDNENQIKEVKKVNLVFLVLLQVYSMFVKKFHWALATWIDITYYVIIWPAVLSTIATFITSKAAAYIAALPSIVLDLRLYGSTEALVKTDNSSLFNKYKDLVNQMGSRCILINDNLIQTLRSKRDCDLTHQKPNIIVAHDLDIGHCLYSPNALHGVPIAINLLYNIRLPRGNIQTLNNPMPQDDPGNFDIQGMAITISVFTVVGLQAAAGSLLRFVHADRRSGAKHVQLSCGVSPFLYWTSTFAFDFLLYHLAVGVVVLVQLTIGRLDLFQDPFHLKLLIFFSLIGGANYIWFHYTLSFFFKNYTDAYESYYIVSYCGMYVRVIMFVAIVNDLVEPEGLVLVIHYMFMVIPPYVVISLYLKLLSSVCKYAKCRLCGDAAETEECINYKKDEIFSWDPKIGVNEDLYYLRFIWFLYFTFIMLIEYGIFEFIYKILGMIFQRRNKPQMKTDLSVEVTQERNKVMELMSIKKTLGITRISLNCDECPAVIARNLSKNQTARSAAIKGLYFIVPHNQCLGLLGPDYSGKSTTLRVLASRVTWSHGNAYISGQGIFKKKLRFSSDIGYNPQNDALIDNLSGWQHLAHIARLRGLSPRHSSKVIQQWVDLLGFNEFKHKMCKTYSKGTKRKLSIALSMVGNPQLLLLDQPTSGVDPIARRKLWSVLRLCKLKGQTVILSSNSQEECESICDRVAIMTQGEIRFFGTMPQVKAKFGQGFSVRVKVNLKQLEAQSRLSLAIIKNRILAALGPGCTLLDQVGGLLVFHLKDNSHTFASVFTIMESLKLSRDIDEYVVTSTTLDVMLGKVVKLVADSDPSTV